MTKNQYRAITNTTRKAVSRLPGGERILQIPTYLCALLYLLTLLILFLRKDPRLIRAAAVPAVCFLAVTALRPLIGRQRPYDRFNLPPVGKWEPGKGKSMPSRHAASAAAIAFAVAYAFPHTAVCILMGLLALLIAALRVLAGQHYPSDAAAAVLLAAVFSAIGYTV